MTTAELAQEAKAQTLTHLQRLEAESIHIMREVAAEAEKPVMLYSVGKDSAVMLHLARKAFYPSPPPFPLLHVDTTWKFKAMYELRNKMAEISGMELLVYQNPEAKERGINPFDHGGLHTDMWKTEGFAETKGYVGTDRLTFDVMGKIKGRFPSRTAQFCTEKLKIFPMLRWVEENLSEEEFIRYSGVRHDESAKRKHIPEYEWDALFDCPVRNPLIEWKKSECFALAKTNGEPINPLYSLGFSRVGCAPCVNSGKDDITHWAQRSPDMIDKVRVWEESVNRTFFAPCVPGIKPRLSPRGKVEIFNWVDEVVEWAKTDRGGYQFKIISELPVASCESKYGLCE